ncbi:MAG: Flp pilus assembly protein CpaB [Methylacidiphilales bacterium]|nr:Flp pilus assembly protein CpaB [Candidatus Methylacidiphilales bacterium]
MKKKSPPYAIIGAAILGILAAFLIYNYLQRAEQEKEQAIKDQIAKDQAAIDAAKNSAQPTVQLTQPNMRNVYYATQPVAAGAHLSPAFYEKKLTPQDLLPDAFTDSTDITEFYAIRTIEKGDPLTPRNIGKSLPFLSERIPPGMREISLPIFNAEVNNTGGYIVDGDRVDLLYSTAEGAGGTVSKVETVMQNLAILSVPGSPVKTDKTDGVNPVPPPGATISVTFEVTPEQAEALLFLAQYKTGHFSMILRGRNDQLVQKVKPFEATDYAQGFKKVQSITDKSYDKVKQIASQIAQIQAQEDANKKQGQGNTNETPPPTTPAAQ